MNVTIGTGRSVHATYVSRIDGSINTRCGSESRKGNYGVGQYSKLVETHADVTCKRCLKAAGEVTVAAAPVAAPVVKKVRSTTETVKCGAVLTKLPYGKHIREHNMTCKTCLYS